ncbi:MAG: metallophosphoesterase family protein [Spirochaetota bacterium]
MKIGILSDTHNDMQMAARAAGIFRQHNVDLIIHAGDIGSADIIEIFRGANIRFILGNCDTDHELIQAVCREAGMEPAARCADFEFDGKKFFICHGDEHSRYREALESKKYDYLILGHTHEYCAKHKGSTLVINPGAATRDDLSDSQPTAAILDVNSGHVEKIILDQNPDPSGQN